MNILLRLFSLACALVLLMGQPIFARAQDANLDDQTYHIAKLLNCPTCAGRNLADCPTQTCAQWKAEIRAQLEQGKSPQEVIAFFEARFGPTVRQEPPREGATAILWAAPIGAAVVFLAIAAWVITQRTAPRNAASALAAPFADDPYAARLEEEVRRNA